MRPRRSGEAGARLGADQPGGELAVGGQRGRGLSRLALLLRGSTTAALPGSERCRCRWSSSWASSSVRVDLQRVDELGLAPRSASSSDPALQTMSFRARPSSASSSLPARPEQLVGRPAATSVAKLGVAPDPRDHVADQGQHDREHEQQDDRDAHPQQADRPGVRGVRVALDLDHVLVLGVAQRLGVLDHRLPQLVGAVGQLGVGDLVGRPVAADLVRPGVPELLVLRDSCAQPVDLAAGGGAGRVVRAQDRHRVPEPGQQHLVELVGQLLVAVGVVHGDLVERRLVDGGGRPHHLLGVLDDRQAAAVELVAPVVERAQPEHAHDGHREHRRDGDPDGQDELAPDPGVQPCAQVHESDIGRQRADLTARSGRVSPGWRRSAGRGAR